MRDIYREADRVILWLGPEFEDSSLGMDMIFALGTGRIKTDDLGSWNTFPEAKTLGSWKAVNNLFLRPFWKRIWIMQEVVLAKRTTIIYGRK